LRHLPSFPTRRSSDLEGGRICCDFNDLLGWVKKLSAFLAYKLPLKVDAQACIKSPGCLRHRPSLLIRAIIRGDIGVLRFENHQRSEEHTSELQSRGHL